MDKYKNIGIAKVTDYNAQLTNFEGGLVSFLKQHDLPSESIFVDIPERLNVFRNIDGVIDRIEDKDKQQSLYLSKFIAAVASGLFDAALNYLWNETIIQIRRRVILYDIEYFYDNAVTGDRRKRLKDENDLPDIDDYDLIKGSREIGLISDLGFKHLEYINYMRNWVSAAHPNQNEITGLQLVSWLETCVKEVISLPISSITTKIKLLLVSIKSKTISESDAQEIAVFFTGLAQEQTNKLASGFFGIYTKVGVDSQTLQNINKLLPSIWSKVDEDTRTNFGIKYANYAANNYQDEKKLSREFLQIVNAESYIPDNLRVVEIDAAIDNLTASHRGFNNFYNEPTFARQLHRIIGDPPKVPKSISKKYVYALIDVFLTNGNGVARAADYLYVAMLKKLDSHQANIATLAFNDTEISSKLQFGLCQTKYKELLQIIKPIITNPAINELINKIESFKGRYEHMKDDRTIKTSVESLKVLLK